MNIFTGVRTDTGTTKDINQDSCLLKVARMVDGRRISLAVICDGMGGLSCGEMASTVFVRRMEKWFYEELPEILSQKAVTTQLDNGEDENRIWANVQYSWSNIVSDMNREIAGYGSSRGIMLGTTNVSQLIIDNRYIAMWIGDSRIYETSEKGIKLLTHDHSLVQHQIDRGQLSEEEAKTSNHKSVLLQCIGASEEVRPDFITGEIDDDVSYILCSDGLWRELDREELLTISRENSSLNASADKMISLVKQRGETDNITVVLINCKAA
ncbi:MAG: serine/threonine-protein phosphatase [Butyrivibrio sp.]|nr:serine/threonine-protein phosphatase [Butyrivibrio sp.]